MIDCLSFNLPNLGLMGYPGVTKNNRKTVMAIALLVIATGFFLILRTQEKPNILTGVGISLLLGGMCVFADLWSHKKTVKK